MKRLLLHPLHIMILTGLALITVNLQSRLFPGDISKKSQYCKHMIASFIMVIQRGARSP